MPNIKFTTAVAYCDRIHYVHKEDVLVVLSRLPREVWSMLRAVHFKDQNRQPYGKGRQVGYTHHGASREIALLALPPRVSLASYLGRKVSPHLYGAIRGYQWPRIAVRRFMLYEVFLHELGHLQIVDPKATQRLRKARDTKADEFAVYWRRVLWSEKYDHPDPAHNPPTKEEMADSLAEMESYKRVL